MRQSPQIEIASHQRHIRGGLLITFRAIILLTSVPPIAGGLYYIRCTKKKSMTIVVIDTNVHLGAQLFDNGKV